MSGPRVTDEQAARTVAYCLNDSGRAISDHGGATNYEVRLANDLLDARARVRELEARAEAAEAKLAGGVCVAGGMVTMHRGVPWLSYSDREVPFRDVAKLTVERVRELFVRQRVQVWVVPVGGKEGG